MNGKTFIHTSVAISSRAREGWGMKIRVFKLNWIVQTDLDFEVHEEHTEKKSLATEAGNDRQTREGRQQRIYGYANKDFVISVWSCRQAFV